jgi:hypothetical protein
MCLIHRWQSGVCGERDVCLGPDENYIITMSERGEWSGPTYLLSRRELLRGSLSDSRRSPLQSSCSIMAQKGYIDFHLFFFYSLPVSLDCSCSWALATMNRFMTYMPTRLNVFSLNSYYSNTLALRTPGTPPYVLQSTHDDRQLFPSQQFLAYFFHFAFIRTSVDRCIKSSCDVGCHDDR